jgi:pyruvate/2-oxoglutarate/acetoin dehydrogenase E1 component/TPP-dependent pyruvate/acetoin dehydrogenase alpha subunit
MTTATASKKATKSKLKYNREEVLADFKLACESRHASLLGRKEVLTGKAKFGIFGDGKEVAQIAMAKVFEKGDFRSGYYRDQTFAMAKGMVTVKQWFAQLYADTDVEKEPASAGRQMNGHFATRSLDENFKWKNLTEQYNSSADISPTGGQMPRLVGLAYASKLYRENPELKDLKQFSINGNEVAFGTIGNASAAEGMFWEAINACGVLMAPVLMSIWDDGYGISVPNKYQMTKDNVGECLSGFAYDAKKKSGYKIYTVKGWDYEGLVETYKKAIKETREKHIPSIIHVVEVTQPQGHSTSGSHERYKSKERLQWEQDYDCIEQMKQYLVKNGYASEEECNAIYDQAKKDVRTAQKDAFTEFDTPVKAEKKQVIEMLKQLEAESAEVAEAVKYLSTTLDEGRKPIFHAIHKALVATRNSNSEARKTISAWLAEQRKINADRYNSLLHSESDERVELVEAVAPQYDSDSPTLDGREVLLNFFEKAFERDPRIFAIGEDVGKIGDVNQGLAGMQEKFGELRVTDTGIRECTILGQGIGASMRGLRPIVEIQYLDYLLYALQIMSDDLATVQYRTKGGQKAPCIIRTRGHRLEGIWHSGSPMAAIINAIRGIHVCVPRNMTQAAAMYNTLLKSDEPGLIVERLNGYRSKEKLPTNVADITLPLGIPEIIQEGRDITIVTYGPCVYIAQEAIAELEKVGISAELIDVQTLLPFDKHHIILGSLQKTNRILFLDEDVPGGTTAYMMQQVLDKQGGYYHLDSEPKCLSAHAHRPAYATDGDYFSKPNAEDIFDTVYGMMAEVAPDRFPSIY